MKTRAVRTLKLGICALWAVSLTALTYVFGAVPAKVLRRCLGRSGFVSLGAALAGGFAWAHNPAMAVALASVFVLVGIYAEFEEMGMAFAPGALATLGVSALLSGGGFAVWVARVGPGWRNTLTASLSEIERPILERFPALGINVPEFVNVAPSVILGLWMTALCAAVWFERARARGAGAANPLDGFRLPDFVVWAFIASVLGRFGDFGLGPLAAVASNVMNGCLILFFFQGVSVAFKFFEVLRAPWPLQVFSTVFLLYGSVMVSFLGLLDFWFDFRARLVKRGATLNRQT